MAMTSTPMAVESLYATGKWFFDTGCITKALDVFRMLVLLAATDERGWLGVGACHDALGQPGIALDLYALGEQAAKSVRCSVARARALRLLERDAEADSALDVADAMLESHDDDELASLVRFERLAS
jgi:hypothetical protein